jgi:hypothetical protein
MTIGKGFEPIEVLMRWRSSGRDCFIGQRKKTEHSEEATLALIGTEIEPGQDLHDVRAQIDDDAATLALAEATRGQNAKALLFAQALVRGMASVLADGADGEKVTIDRDHLLALLDSARLVVENLGGGESGVNAPG